MRKHGRRHRHLHALYNEHGGSHCALVVGELTPHFFSGYSADLRFTQNLKNRNGQGQPVELRIEPYGGEVLDKTELRYLAKVSHVDEATIQEKGMLFYDRRTLAAVANK